MSSAGARRVMISGKRVAIWVHRVCREIIDNVVEPESSVREAFDVPQNKSAVDKALHVVRCEWVVVEEKAKDLGTAINQLKSFVKTLKQRGANVRRCIIILERMSRVERRRYARSSDAYRYLLIKRGRRRPRRQELARVIMHIDDAPVHLLMRGELEGALDRWL